MNALVKFLRWVLLKAESVQQGRKQKSCGAKGHCVRCKAERFHYCCKCDAAICEHVENYRSHMDHRPA